MAPSPWPPLALLPAFVAAGRLGSFKAAAHELHVTPSAVSQQIKTLEEALGVTLFQRGRRAITLTPEGLTYLQDIQIALNDVATATRRVRRRAPSDVLRIHTSAFIASEFLIPRLASFRARFPGVELRTESSIHMVDLALEECDAALRVGGGKSANVRCREVGQHYVMPICNPSVSTGISKLDDLFEHPLIELRAVGEGGWSLFGERVEGAQIITLDTYLECVRAVEQGLGVGYGLFPLTTEWVERGRIAVPLPERFPGRSLNWLYRSGDKRPLLNEVGAWLEEQFAALADPQV